MFFDCLALGIGLFASVMAAWTPDKHFTYGYGRVETLSGFANGVFLLLISVFIIFEAVQRMYVSEIPHVRALPLKSHRLPVRSLITAKLYCFMPRSVDPPEMQTDQLLLVSSVGLAINLFGMFATGGHAHHGHSHGVRLSFHCFDTLHVWLRADVARRTSRPLQGGHSHGAPKPKPVQPKLLKKAAPAPTALAPPPPASPIAHRHEGHSHSHEKESPALGAVKAVGHGHSHEVSCEAAAALA